jgi:hypothetical protein
MGKKDKKNIKKPKIEVYILLFLILNLLLFLKLKFYIPQLTGNSTLLDFGAYFRLIGDIKKGINPYTVIYAQTLGPPAVFLYFLPFSVFPINVARGLFTFINISCGFLSCYLLASHFYPKGKIIVFLILNLIFFSAFPVRFSIENGQPILVIGYLVSLLICSPKTKYLNIILGLIIIIKTNYLIALTALIRKNLELVLKTILTILLILIFLFPIVKPSFYSYYFSQKTQNILPVLEKNKSLDYYNQSIPSTLSRLGVIKYQREIYIFICLALVYLMIKTSNLSLGILSSIILSPVSWQHYYAALFPIFVLTFFKLKRSTFLKGAFSLSVFLWWIEFPLLHQAETNFANGLLASHYFISAILLMVVVIRVKSRYKAKNPVKYDYEQEILHNYSHRLHK